MNHARRSERSHRSLFYAAVTALSLGSFISVACSDDPPDVVGPAGGAGGSTTASNNIGGFGMGPSGPGAAGPGGGGGQGNQGGTGDPGFEFGTTFSGATAGKVSPKDVAVDSAGNIIVVGSYSGVVNLGGADLPDAAAQAPALDNVFVAKYSSAGAHVWSFGGGNGEVQAATSVTVDSANEIWLAGVVKGTFTFPGGTAITQTGPQFQDCWLAKLDVNGNELFSENYAAAANQNCEGSRVAAGPSNQVLFGGTFGEALALDGGLTGTGLTMFLARYDATGATIASSAAYGGPGADETSAVAFGLDGAMAIGGSATGDITFGTTLTNPAGSPRAVVAAFNAAGQEQFAKLFPSGGEGNVVDLAYHSNGDLFVLGVFAQTIDLGSGELSATGGAKETFIARFDPSGNLVYGSRFGGIGVDEPFGLDVNSGGFATLVGRTTDDIVVNGMTTLTYDSTNNDAFMIHVGPPGQGYWGYATRALSTAMARGVAIDPTDDTIVVVGEYNGAIDLGAGPVGTGDTGGMFIMKFSAAL